MLILTRKESESILIDGDRVKIEVLKIREDNVRLGIKAPKDIAIYRAEELKDKLNNDNKSTTND